MPKLILNIHNSGPYDEGPCDYALVEMTSERAAKLCRLVQLAAHMKETLPGTDSFWSLQFFVYDCEPLNCDQVDELEERDVRDAETGNPLCSEMLGVDACGYAALPDDVVLIDADDPRSLNSDTLVVTDDGIYWEVSAKHGAARGETPELHYADLARWAGLVDGPPVRTLDLSEQLELRRQPVPAPTWIKLRTTTPAVPTSTP